jgi:MYXO-CTERM domain-containing protein
VNLARRTAVVVSAAVCGLVPAVAAGSGDAGVPMAFRMHDDRVIESSALALSRTHPGLAYTVNDSGHEAEVLVVSLQDGSVVGQATLAGAENDDFEALSPARGGRLLVGDIGDNDFERDSVELYVIDEPAAGDSEVHPRTVELTYPGGPRDAETVVAIGDTVYVVSKEALGGVYAAPVLGSSRDRFTLRRVATAPGVVTDGALLADGDVMLRSYNEGYLVRMPGWRVLTSFPLPRTQLGESVAAPPRGRRVYVGSEGSDSPVYRVRVPTAAEVPRPARSPAGPAKAAPDETAPSADEAEQSEGPLGRPTGYVVAVAAALVLGFLLRRRRRRPIIRVR